MDSEKPIFIGVEVHSTGREPDFIDMDHIASALSNSAKTLYFLVRDSD